MFKDKNEGNVSSSAVLILFGVNGFVYGSVN